MRTRHKTQSSHACRIQLRIDGMIVPVGCIGSGDAINTLAISSMMPFEITSEETDQSPNGKLTPTMVGTAAQITENLVRYKEAGMTMPMLWPPFAGTPTAKTIDDLRQLKEDIMPQVV